MLDGNLQVETFVAVGGVAYGFQNCDRKHKACNDHSSMYCGSLLLKELNSQPNRFEGNYTYAILSFADDVLGVYCCNHKCAELRHAIFSIGFPDMDHLTISSATKFLQLACLDHPQLKDIRRSAKFFADGTKIITDY
ncbi:unnamed protein product [Gongylonema pulchrum]|uniref:Reverse transcriptase Ty1/copia-type domain-containing protein n=1 Tax=Gongylonema pulchrum TaxID=637853 RepID=A0A183DHE5_9BILA|nr:unnamed protein product [Gongylonema pulchrum]